MEIKSPISKSWFAALEIGLTLPVFMTVVFKVRLVYLARNKQEKDLTGESKSCKNWSKLEKLTNGLVIWLLICCLPTIAKYHWELIHYLQTGKQKTDAAWVISDMISRIYLIKVISEKTIDQY